MSNWPQEVVELVIDHHDDDIETLCRCALVGRLWTSRSQQHIFQRVSIDVPPPLKLSGPDARARLTPKWLSFQSAVINTPKLGEFVRKLQFALGFVIENHSDVFNQDWWFSDAGCNFEKAFSSLPNVSSVSVNLSGLHWSQFGPISSAWAPILQTVSSLEIRQTRFKSFINLRFLIFQCPVLKDLALQAIKIEGRPQPQQPFPNIHEEDNQIQLRSLCIGPVMFTEYPATDGHRMLMEWFCNPRFGINTEHVQRLSLQSETEDAERLITNCHRALKSLRISRPTSQPLAKLLIGQLTTLGVTFEEYDELWMPWLADFLGDPSTENLQEIMLHLDLDPDMLSSFNLGLDWDRLDSILDGHRPSSLQRIVIHVPGQGQKERMEEEIKRRLPLSVQTFGENLQVK